MSVANGCSYFCKLAKVMLGCALISMSACARRPPGSGTDRGGVGLGIAPTAINKIHVLWAAPVRTTETFPGTFVSGKLKLPPPYVSTLAVTVHPSHEKPSSCCTLPPTFDPCPKNCNGGTTGIAPGMDIVEGGSVGACEDCWNACTRVNVWLPESAKNMQQAPTTNDPNASVTLDIRSPLDGERGDCAVWTYHYGNPPEKSMPIAPEMEFIGGGRAKAGSQSSMPPIPEAP
jgi:hypothetical protein